MSKITFFNGESEISWVKGQSKTFTNEQLVEDLLDDSEVIATSYWRHGTRDTRVFGFEGKHYKISFNNHTNDGWQLFDKTYECVEVRKVPKTVLVWEDVSGEAKLSKLDILLELGQRAVDYHNDSGLCVFCNANAFTNIPHADHCNVNLIR